MQYRRIAAGLLALSLFALPSAASAQDDGEDPPQAAEESQETTEQAPDADAGAEAEWQKSFPADKLLTYLPDDQEGVIVVAAGDHAQAEPAADTIERALRSTNAHNPVMNDDVLADNAKVDDETIIEKTKHLPVLYVTVVRVFGDEGQPAMAVVTFYDKDTGESVSAFSTERGQPMPATEQPSSSADSGVSQEAADAVSETTETSEKTVEGAKQEYLENFVWFQDIVGVNESGGVVGQWTTAYRGKFKEPLEGADFYEEVGRPDLADEYRTNSTLRWTGLIVGYTAAIGGTLLLFAGEDTVWCSDRYTDDIYGESAGYKKCEAYNDRIEDENERLMFTGLGISVGGLLVAGIATFYNPHPVDAPEARRLANTHNKNLRKDLGLSDSPEAAKMKWSLDVDAMPGEGGGLRLRVDF
jgi:hypothetical protein